MSQIKKDAVLNVTASSTGTTVVAAVAFKAIRVVQVAMVTAATATNVTFNTSSGAAISPLFANGANGGAVLNYNSEGWFTTVPGDGLTVTTGAGSTTGILIGYVTI